MKRSKALSRRNPPSPAPRRPPASRGRGAKAPPPPRVLPPDYPRFAAVRTLFWHNIMREFLTSLSAIGEGGPGSKLAPPPGDDLGDIFDGRLAVLTQGGERIPIGRVTPLLACGLSTGSLERAISMAVECTVFEIVTPDGESFTLPLHEIRAFHSLTAELVSRIEQAARSRQGEAELPFGFAAFTSLVRGSGHEGPDLPPDAAI